MKKILITTLIFGLSSLAIADNSVISFKTINNTNNGNAKNLAQCREIDENKLNIMSQINMQKEICLFENYAKLTERWTTNPPETYVPPRSIVLNINKKEVSPEIKEKLNQTSQQCQDLGAKMREKLKEMYGVDKFVCK